MAVHSSDRGSAQLDIFQSGTFFWKVRNIDKFYRRKYFLDVAKQQIIYEGSHKFGCGTTEMQTIDIGEINEVRKGWATDALNIAKTRAQKNPAATSKKTALISNENACLSIIYGHPLQTLDLIADDDRIRNLWADKLTEMINSRKNICYDDRKKLSLKKSFHLADKDQSKSLTFEECLKLLKERNVKLPSRKFAKDLFSKAHSTQKTDEKDVALDEDEFVVFFNSISKRTDLEHIMKKFGKNGAAEMGAEELSKFFLEEQKMKGNYKPSDCQIIINQYEKEYSSVQLKEKILTLTGFTKLMTEEQKLFNPEHSKVFQDMTQPMSHYYIASSHNTYLTGNQLAGNSSVEGYITALKRGCRCVEMDLWDGDDGEPVIYHGHTLVSKIKFEDVIVDAIVPYGFKTSEFPLILSLENHCSIAQQQKIAKYMNDHLKDKLYCCKPLILGKLEELPSPENLKGKIIIKGKKLADSENPEENKEEPCDSEDEEDVEENNEIQQKPQAKKPPVDKDLSDLVNISRSVHFKSFTDSRDNGKCYDIVSLSENKALSLIAEDAKSFVEHTRRNMVRIYPKGLRTGSSNYKPIPMWLAGAQIVALNYQSGDKPNLINAAKFLTNGNCGYVLKPKYLLEGSFDPKNPGDEHKKTLQLRVISGQCLPKPENDKKGEVVDPYVVVKIHGHPDDKQKYQTKVIENNGFNPIWEDDNNETGFQISLKLPEVSFLHFIVYDSDQGRDDKLAQCVIPFVSIQNGYRHLSLMTKHGKMIDEASLFVHISIKD